ncbi:GGDEF domain-containing protein [Sedimenticola hydrogenitrophicus]|uniref:GGDEF domain-containing protein n=1 Tax=Sedimenticola hydrogenitrophicus TaxID=2967975 RepID=UPI0021A8DB47|nr:sensor domain-containing diguanylate cyclase [Sedimenticola hydrogenitrophicus]
MNLKSRFSLITLLLIAVSAIAGWGSVRTLAEDIVAQWAMRYAEKQALYDKSRTLQPILREVALARQLAHSQYIREWTRKPDDPERSRRAITEMESFRQSFHDQNYFVALLKNGHYYYNNAENEYAGKEFRYTLDPKQAKDAWFYDLIRQGRDLHINVNPDLELGITRLWIDVLIRDGNDILGMAGTGLDLTGFIQNVVEEEEPGVTSLFVDHTGAIQIHRNESLIDFGSISKNQGEQHTIDLLFDQPADRTAILAAMKVLEDLNQTVITEFVSVNGKRHLAGITYLPEIGWYEITLLDLDVLLPFSQFSGILLVYAITLLGAFLLLHLFLNHQVLNPLSQLDRAMSRVESGADVTDNLGELGTGEIRRLMQRFLRMAHAVLESRHDLESKIQERTLALERLTKIDPLTELLNRRGMTERIETELQRIQREPGQVGLLWLDVDWFKQINDHHGHAVGDQALRLLADIIRNTLRPYDVASRWGGDEFLVLVQPADADTLDQIGTRLNREIAENRQLVTAGGEIVPLSASIGGHLSREGEPLDSLLQRADQALYAAKAAGRNCYRSTAEIA